MNLRQHHSQFALAGVTMNTTRFDQSNRAKTWWPYAKPTTARNEVVGYWEIRHRAATVFVAVETFGEKSRVCKHFGGQRRHNPKGPPATRSWRGIAWHVKPGGSAAETIGLCVLYVKLDHGPDSPSATRDAARHYLHYLVHAGAAVLILSASRN